MAAVGASITLCSAQVSCNLRQLWLAEGQLGKVWNEANPWTKVVPDIVRYFAAEQGHEDLL